MDLHSKVSYPPHCSHADMLTSFFQRPNRSLSGRWTIGGVPQSTLQRTSSARARCQAKAPSIRHITSSSRHFWRDDAHRSVHTTRHWAPRSGFGTCLECQGCTCAHHLFNPLHCLFLHLAVVDNYIPKIPRTCISMALLSKPNLRRDDHVSISRSSKLSREDD